MTSKSKEKLRRIVKYFDPEFKDKWIVYEDVLKNNLSEEIAWIDIGCGKNGNVYELGKFTRCAVGVDVTVHKERYNAPFLLGDIYHLPLKTNSIGLVSLRFVVEHIRDIQACMNEIARVLKDNGKVLIFTSNIYSPYILLPNLVPYGLKKYLIQKILRAEDEDIFPTYHKMNSPRGFKKKVGHLRKIMQVYIQDVYYERIWLFLFLFGWHLLTKKVPFLGPFRTNIIAMYQKIK